MSLLFVKLNKEQVHRLLTFALFLVRTIKSRLLPVALNISFILDWNAFPFLNLGVVGCGSHEEQISEKKNVLIKTRETKTFQQSRLFIILLNGHFSGASVIDSKYIKQGVKIFTKLVPLQTLSRNSHRRCSVKGVLKNLRNFIGIHLCWGLFLIKLQTFSFLLWNFGNF